MSTVIYARHDERAKSVPSGKSYAANLTGQPVGNTRQHHFHILRRRRVCGIIGLFLKNPELEPDLGRHAAAMLEVLSDRGPDSAGFAVYDDGVLNMVKLTLRNEIGCDFAAVAETLTRELSVAVPLTVHADHAVIMVPVAQEATARAHIAALLPGISVVGSGNRMELYKGIGRPRDVSQRFGLPDMRGTHAIGHTRMATESAVTAAGAHPFSTGPDQCLVHNGSLSNHNAVRRMLRRQHIVFETENDTEVAGGYLTWRLSQGLRLDEALTAALTDLDGFYTFVVGTRSGFGVLRDPIACKPAVMAETDDYVAFGSEYRALVDLPNIEHAHIFEPEPQRVYFWERPGLDRPA
jgi:methylamine---glutamate N-methyltransferase subunit A